MNAALAQPKQPHYLIVKVNELLEVLSDQSWVAQVVVMVVRDDTTGDTEPSMVENEADG